jgi:hypothetical protein
MQTRRSTLPITAAICSCRTVAEVSVNLTGLVVAVISVLTSALQQILCGVLQRKHKVSSHQLLSNTAGMQVCVCRRQLGVLKVPEYPY